MEIGPSLDTGQEVNRTNGTTEKQFSHCSSKDQLAEGKMPCDIEMDKRSSPDTATNIHHDDYNDDYDDDNGRESFSYNILSQQIIQIKSGQT